MRVSALIGAAVLACLATAAQTSPDLWAQEWPQTNFDKTTVESWDEIRSGGPPKDGIPALSDPAFIAVGEEQRIGDREPVIAVEIDGPAACLSDPLSDLA